MSKEAIDVLYICHDRVQLAGAVYSMINMIESLGDYVTPHILVRKGIVSDTLKRKGFDCILFPFQLNVTRNYPKGLSWLNKFRVFIDDVVNYIGVCYTTYRMRKVVVSIVHSNSTATSIGYTLAKKLSAKHVWHIREFLDLDFGMAPSKGWDFILNRIYDSDFVIAITKDVFNHWKLENCKQSIVLFNAVRSKTDVIINKEKQKYLLFCSAKLSDGKGTDFAVKLYCNSNLHKDGYRLKIIGAYDKKYKQKLDAIARDFGLLNYIDYLGYQTDVKDYIANATVLLMCSEREAMGRITVEAMFFGCPVLGHNTGGTKEIIIDGENGLLYDAMDDALEKLNILTKNEEKRNYVIQNGVSIAKSLFSKESYGVSILNIYKNILSRSSINV